MRFWNGVNAFGDHRLLMLSRHLSQVNMVGIYLSHELGWTICHMSLGGLSHMPKHPCVEQEVQIHSLNWLTGTGTEFPRPHNFFFWSFFLLLLQQPPYCLPTNRFSTIFNWERCCDSIGGLWLLKHWLCFSISILIKSTTELGSNTFTWTFCFDMINHS